MASKLALWCAYTRNCQRLRRVGAQILRRWQLRWLQPAWLCLVDSVQGQRRLRKCLQRAVARWQQTTAARAWSSWARHLAQRRTLKATAKKVFDFAQRVLVAGIRGTYSHWRHVAEQEQRLRSRRLRALACWTRRSQVIQCVEYRRCPSRSDVRA